MQNTKRKRAQRRKMRVRGQIQGTSETPRLSVFRSNKGLYAQLIDDANGKTLLGVSEKQLAEAKSAKSNKAKALGLFLGKKALALKIVKVKFDRGSYSYHGRVKAFADGAREAGLQF